MEGERSKTSRRRRLPLMTLTALGIVFGDIGTSPLYAMGLCFLGPNRIGVTEANVLGVLSLIIWSLLVIISAKYLLFVMRADNHGEGGILALVAQLNPWRARTGSPKYILMLVGLFGAALLYGDGTITPAISVLSAIEGLSIAAPIFGPYIVPLTITVLVALFLFQRRGTSGIGIVFGPIILIWFLVIGALGLRAIWHMPHVLMAFDPRYAGAFLFHNGFTGFAALGAVFLVVTGGEALYADMGHFGRRPIRFAWFGLVLPALVLNYMGQGAYILAAPATFENPFYHLAPDWALYPLVALATLATVIASQAVISGAFSLTRQAIQLKQLPHAEIVQTSPDEFGQIYIPIVNWLLMAATIGLVLGFGSSVALAGAYGVAVTTTMVITSVLFYFVALRWGWHPIIVAALTGAFLIVDITFFCANMLKVVDGGWYPLLVGAVIFTLMTTWHTGRTLLARRLRSNHPPLDAFFEELRRKRPLRVPGTAVFMTSDPEGTPPMLPHLLTHNRVLHKRIILFTLQVEDIPRMPPAERVAVEKLRLGFYRVIARYGFMENPNVPAVIRQCKEQGLDVDIDKTTYYLGRETLIPSDERVGMMLWREHLFAFMARNAARPTAYYRIPPAQVVELGIQVEM